MYHCILDQDGNIVYDRNLPCDPKAILQAIAPFRDGVVVGVECMFGDYGCRNPPCCWHTQAIWAVWCLQCHA
jgi:hypothetical protein